MIPLGRCLNEHSGKESTCQRRGCKTYRFNPWVRKIPWSRKWKSTPVFLPGESCGQWSLPGEHARTDSARKFDYFRHGNLFHIFMNSYRFSQFNASVVSDSAIPWTAAHQASPSIISSWSLLKLMSIESVMPSNLLILCHLLPLLPSVFPSIRVFCNESVLSIN